MSDELVPKEVIDALGGVLKTTVQSPEFKQTIGTLLGEAGAEVGRILADEVRRYRSRRIIEGLIKTQAFLRQNGINPRSPSIKVLFPLLEGMSFEENDDLHTMWAALLANASNPDTPDLVHPSFAGILKQLSAADAVILNDGFDCVSASLRKIHEVRPDHLLVTSLRQIWFNPWDFDQHVGERIWSDRAAISYSSLQSSFLVERGGDHASGVLNMTAKGYYFVLACRAPALRK